LNNQISFEPFHFPYRSRQQDIVGSSADAVQLAKVAYSTHFEEDTYEVFDSVAGY